MDAEPGAAPRPTTLGRRVRRWSRIAGPVLVLGLLVWRLGTGPFLQGIRSIDAGALALGAGLTALSTVAGAWRWTVVAGGLGVKLSLPGAVAAYYRALFLNLTLPGGVVGDIHRGVSHGRDVSDLSRGLRAVVLERFAGQVVQVLVTVVILLALPSPVQSSMPLVAAAVLGAAFAVLLVSRLRSKRVSRWARLRAATARDIRDGLLAHRAWVGIALASVLAIAGHAITFLVAARTAGAMASPGRMLPIAMLAMMAMVLPSVAGWGPREGVTAWTFGAAGLGAGRGIATGVVYGAMVLVACSPGAFVLIVAHRRPRLPRWKRRPFRERAAHA